MQVGDIFKVHIAKSHSFKKYKSGPAAFVTNGLYNNGIQGFVSPFRGDRVFDFEGICVSGFCEATVQEPPFLGRGNGGSGLIVLEPPREMERRQLLSYASYLNKFVRWRFSYGRMVSKSRILNIKLPDFEESYKDIKIKVSAPEYQEVKKRDLNLRYKSFKIGLIFNLHSGDYHNAGALQKGKVALASCGDKNNGIIKFVKVPADRVYRNCLTIAYNGQPLTNKYHPYNFAAKDDIAICIPKRPMKVSTLIFIQYVLDNEKWRFSYGRKCFREKLSQMSINLPVDRNRKINEKLIETIMKNTSYWGYLKKAYDNGIDLCRDIVE